MNVRLEQALALGFSSIEECDEHQRWLERQAEMRKPVRRMLCACCGAVTHGRQWHNRDTGYGLCVDCIDYCMRGETPESFRSLYGDRGVHFDVKEVC